MRVIIRLAFRTVGGGIHRNRTTSGGGRAASAWVRIKRAERMVSTPPGLGSFTRNLAVRRTPLDQFG
ncbi:MAG: hypothetical protein CMJ22_11730 [Phycisphaerae bacterium]|nr:hypothetical protein [Phycisphaerae bacterium]